MTAPHIDNSKLGALGSADAADGRGSSTVFDVSGLSVSYKGNVALKDVDLEVKKNFVTAFIGPSGCGKSTFIRCFNRMNDLIPGAAVNGSVLYHGKDLYGSDVDPVEVRRLIGMVFQKPNPFPKSIYENVAFGPKVLGMKDALDERIEGALQSAALWDEVKDRLKENALGLSGGQQQRLCIARAIAVEPEVILMDEPASALDPISTSRIEDLIHELKQRLHDRDRDAQHAAGGAGCRHDGVLQRRGAGGRQRAARHSRRARPDDEDLHESGRQANRGLRHRAVRVIDGPRRVPAQPRCARGNAAGAG